MTSPQDPSAALQAFFQAGQAFAQGMARFMQGQQGQSQPYPPYPDWQAQWAAFGAGAQPGAGNPALAALQQEWQQSHATLWRTMLQRKKDEAAAPPAPLVQAEPGDRRFADPAWAASPIYDYLRQAYLLNAGYLKKMAAATPLPDGLEKNRLQFMTRQIVDALAPSNFAATNPEFIQKALETEGESIRRGLQNLIGDLEKGRISMTDDSAFEVGRNLATTPGAVVFENEIFQLLQYAPLTDTVARRPLLIVPPCINKYYILDLQPENSFVRYAVEQGQTVFLISWRNPQAAQGRLTWDDYLEHGALTALNIVREICRVEQTNALGFCVGGTILSAALAVARARGENPVASLTLLTTLLDFTDTGEIGCFVDERSVANREATIGKGGLLTARELAATFSALRANDLIWQYVVGNYLKGNQPTAFDLLYWNSDSTNLPGPFAAWYLRNLYLENNLRVPGKLSMCGVKTDLGKVDMPAFILATREDHIVPWQSAYLSRQLLGGESRFILGASGHVAGVINPAAKNKRSHWTSAGAEANPEEWLAGATEVKGSWWPDWAAWLRHFADGAIGARAKLGSKRYATTEPAPGRYVRARAE